MEQGYILVELLGPADEGSNGVFLEWLADRCLVSVDSEADSGHLDLSATLGKSVRPQDAATKPVLLVVAVNVEEFCAVDKVFLAPFVVFLRFRLKLSNVG